MTLSRRQLFQVLAAPVVAKAAPEYRPLVLRENVPMATFIANYDRYMVDPGPPPTNFVLTVPEEW